METQNSIVRESSTKVYSTERVVLIVIVSLIIGAVLGIFIGSYFSFGSSSKKDYQAGFDAAKKLVDESSVGGLLNPTDLRALSGTVTAINGNRLTIQTQSVNPFDTQTLSDRTVFIGTSTKVIQLLPSVKSPGKYMQTATSSASIKVGDSLTVVAGENIKSLQEFTAKVIQIIAKTALK